MKVLIVSDSHGLTKPLLDIADRYRGKVDLMIHCGDSELELEAEELKDFKVVRGNCDFRGEFQEELIHHENDFTIYAVHGHLHGIKQSLQKLYYRCREVGATIACFGHSHVLGTEVIDGILFINPGSILLPRMRKEKTYAILDTDGKIAKVTFYTTDGNELVSQSFDIK
ncbi:YfcE family phosphodiesterase [Gottfriedia luciferensis]|uniref:YfcE family phosphodiesterase n=1 Tax=Gottfriedia luciferensis TaxID=178774 RepID=UPI000B441179|nr:metallophosphoesterase [Gottfriedia luciferensis]